MIREYNKQRYIEAIERVDPKEIYNLSTMTRANIFWWVTNLKTIKRLVKVDMNRENILQAKVTGQGKGLKYQIEGRNIIKLLKKYGPGIEFVLID
ncbi:hypothetical protein KAU11_10405 [Candidatus Babeliales bacterium]|nr:hypothetical protein [Candidatus Babeliales bacterium]